MPRIIIVKKQSRCFIEPPHTPAGPTDTVIFSAVNIDVDSRVIINFPGSYPFTDGDPDKPGQITIGGNTSVSKNIPGGISPGVYPFSAYCVECNTFAEGGSFGELIVGP